MTESVSGYPLIDDEPQTIAHVALACDYCDTEVSLDIDAWIEVDEDGDNVLRLDAGTMDLEAHLLTHQ